MVRSTTLIASNHATVSSHLCNLFYVQQNSILQLLTIIMSSVWHKQSNSGILYYNMYITSSNDVKKFYISTVSQPQGTIS